MIAFIDICGIQLLIHAFTSMANLGHVSWVIDPTD